LVDIVSTLKKSTLKYTIQNNEKLCWTIPINDFD